MSCKRCGSWAINHGHHGRDGSDPELCDVCYWRKRTEAKDAELAGYVEANRYMKGELDDALEDARKYAEAQREIARLRAELARVAEPARVIAAHAADAMAAKDMVIGALLDTLRQWQYAENNSDRDELANARTNRDEALAQVAEVGNG